MAFTSAITGKKLLKSDPRYDTRTVEIWGTFTELTSDTGGAIETGLTRLDHFQYSFVDTVSADSGEYTVSGGTATISHAAGPLGGSWQGRGIP